MTTSNRTARLTTLGAIALIGCGGAPRDEPADDTATGAATVETTGGEADGGDGGGATCASEATTIEDYRSEILRNEQGVDSALGEGSSVDCRTLRGLVERICELADRICDIAEREPLAGAQCSDATARCENARTRTQPMLDGGDCPGGIGE